MSNRYTIMRVKLKGYAEQLLQAVQPKLEALGVAVPKPQFEVAELSQRELRQLRSEPEVVAVAPAMPIKLIAPLNVPQATSATSAWGLEAVGAVGSPFDGTGVTVAVLDTGIDAQHPAFAGMTLVERDFTGDGNGDSNGHGTHCAGTIFGRDVEQTRIGVARGVQTALIAKVLGRDGGNSESLFQALDWALREADVVSMSMGFDFPGYVARLVVAGYPPDLATSQALIGFTANLRMLDALMGMNRAQDAYGLGSSAVVVAASGNESQAPGYRISCSLPAAAEGIISVGAAQQGAYGLSVAPFSNTMVDVVGPGVDVLSARSGGGLLSLSGTSMATPHVAGIAALWWQKLRKGDAGPAFGRNVIARLVASAGPSGLANDVDLASRGNGLVAAPK